ncbi:MAG TPA: DoxX family protein [Bryobacteraceae bacterium]|nr:DoxX family protein [Bryobacteraceae bacterium]
MTRALWIVQIVLALLFLFAGGTKLVMPAAQLTGQTPLPALFLRFIGVAEIAGALGLILPGALRIRPGLTPLAAACLTIIMIGATIVTVMTMGAVLALLPFIVGLLTVFVAYARWRVYPQLGKVLP